MLEAWCSLVGKTLCLCTSGNDLAGVQYQAMEKAL